MSHIVGMMTVMSGRPMEVCTTTVTANVPLANNYVCSLLPMKACSWLIRIWQITSLDIRLPSTQGKIPMVIAVVTNVLRSVTTTLTGIQPHGEILLCLQATPHTVACTEVRVTTSNPNIFVMRLGSRSRDGTIKKIVKIMVVSKMEQLSPNCT